VPEIVYTQTWPEPYLGEQTAERVLEAFDTEEIVWLREQGYECRMFHSFVPLREHSIWTVKFSVPDAVITYISLRWPSTRSERELDCGC
jgi:hypothetical protein